MDYTIIIEREPGSSTCGAYAADPDINVYVVRDASATDEELIVACKDGIELLFETLREKGLPIPQPHCRGVTVAVA
jgi:predicted RNase H-like HicB family nuclease